LNVSEQPIVGDTKQWDTPAVICWSREQAEAVLADHEAKAANEACMNALAVKVVNLRRALIVANRGLKEAGRFGVLCSEDEGPSFDEGRAFWAGVRALCEGKA